MIRLPSDSIRWVLRDIPRMLRSTDPQPLPPPWSTAETKLKLAAEDERVRVVDLRGMDRMIHYDPEDWGWFRGGTRKKNVPRRGRARGTLPWEKRTAIMLHTCAVDMRSPRFLGCPCHDGISQDGAIVLCHPHNALVYHGHSANRFSIGVEISGKRTITDKQIKSARILLRFITEERQEHHEGQMAIVAHRMSHRSRVNDPDAQIWRELGVWAIDVLGLKLGPTVGSGRTIPIDWCVEET